MFSGGRQIVVPTITKEVVFRSDINNDGIEDRVVKETKESVRVAARSENWLMPKLGSCVEDVNRTVPTAGEQCSTDSYYVEYGTLDGGYSAMDPTVVNQTIFHPGSDVFGTAIHKVRPDIFEPVFDKGGSVVGGDIYLSDYFIDVGGVDCLGNKRSMVYISSEGPLLRQSDALYIAQWPES